MGWTTDIILHFDETNDMDSYLKPEEFGARDKALIDQINVFFTNHSEGALVELNAPGHWYGGTGGFDKNVYIGAFKHLKLESLLAHLRQIKSANPDNVQLILKDENDSKFRVVEVFKEGAA